MFCICIGYLYNNCFDYITGPTTELPVKVTGNVNIGFTAEFTPHQVGAHSISVEYNGHAVNGTPYIAKAYDSSKVLVGHVPKGHVGNTFQFTGTLKHILHKIFNYSLLLIYVFIILRS